MKITQQKALDWALWVVVGVAVVLLIQKIAHADWRPIPILSTAPSSIMLEE